MKKKAIQTLVYLNSRQTPRFDTASILQSINQLPNVNHYNLQQNAKQYATYQLQSQYGIVTPQPMTKEQIDTTQQILNKIQQLRKTKSIRLAYFIERISQKMNFEQLQEARQFLQALERMQVRQLSFNLDLLQSIVNQKLERQNEFAQNHTIAAAVSLIQELKKVKRADQL